MNATKCHQNTEANQKPASNHRLFRQEMLWRLRCHSNQIFTITGREGIHAAGDGLITGGRRVVAVGNDVTRDKILTTTKRERIHAVDDDVTRDNILTTTIRERIHAVGDDVTSDKILTTTTRERIPAVLFQ